MFINNSSNNTIYGIYNAMSMHFKQISALTLILSSVISLVFLDNWIQNALVIEYVFWSNVGIVRNYWYTLKVIFHKIYPTRRFWHIAWRDMSFYILIIGIICVISFIYFFSKLFYYIRPLIAFSSQYMCCVLRLQNVSGVLAIPMFYGTQSYVYLELIDSSPTSILV